MAVTLFGIKNCDTVKKARQWLDINQIDYLFYDFRADGLDERRLRSWLSQAGAEQLVNKRSSTWRKLSAQQKAQVDNSSAYTLILDNPTLIKRPVLQQGKNIHIGFSEKQYAAVFALGNR